MLDDRDLKHDLLALGLLAATLLLTAAVLSYHPADAPSHLVFPTAEQTHNLCGRVGALLAFVAFEGLGLGAFYVIVSLGVLAGWMLARRDVDRPVLRLAGWLASLAGLTGLATMLLGGLSPGPVIGAGGYLGAAVAGWFEMHLAWLGALICSASLTVAGLLLCTEYALVRMLAIAVGKPTAHAARALSPALGKAMMRIIRRAETEPHSEAEKDWTEWEDDLGAS